MQVAVGEGSGDPPAAAAGFPVAVGGSFRDRATTPEMVVIPAGRFMMGSSEAETTLEGRRAETCHMGTPATPGYPRPSARGGALFRHGRRVRALRRRHPARPGRWLQRRHRRPMAGGDEPFVVRSGLRPDPAAPGELRDRCGRGVLRRLAVGDDGTSISTVARGRMGIRRARRHDDQSLVGRRPQHPLRTRQWGRPQLRPGASRRAAGQSTLRRRFRVHQSRRRLSR